ncbi:site-specific DNA-methyltransferase [Mycoplasma sp. CSL7475-4]|uniref:DNA-methyltransferase n=1 Tax=Mycoplasma sp. CSL7475-4 TaxID=2973942 RepID=UPI00216B5AA2|nr:site-specific DNA-methyltransferase [Mycoplasma sp. CSL7475-4]MCS4537061.1 site-specific DNA-methyltransferase [Mycoplasma sp. CSL7475-4]
MLEIEKIKNTIIMGDNIDILKKIPSGSIDFIFADPPYFMQTEGELLRVNGEKFDGVEDDWDKFNSFEEYDNFSINWLKECQRVLKDNGSICVIGSFQNIYRIGYIMQNLGYWIINDIVWNKTNPVPNFAGTRLCNSHETLIWFSKNKKSKVSFNYKTMKYLNNNKQEKSVWNIAICNGNERLKDENGKKLHSTQKPEELLYKIILSATKPNDIVLDPFFGTGTTGAVAKRIGRNYIGIEREEKYIKGATKRLKLVKNESTDIENLKLEIKPPKVPLDKLVDMKYLSIGDKLYNSNKKEIAVIVEKGKVFDGEDTLSIHKMSAKKLNKLNYNGWDYFYIIYNNEFIPLDNLRYKYAKENN